MEHRDGTSSTQIAPVRKTIYSLPPLAQLLGAANRRYLEFLSALDDPSAGIREAEQIARPVRRRGRTYRGFNPFAGDDLDLFITLARGEFTISGLRNRDLRPKLSKNPGQVSRILKRLRLHGIIKKVGRAYKYYLTRRGRSVIATALRLRHEIALPALGAPAPP